MIEECRDWKEKFIKKGFRLYFFTYLGAPIGYLIKIILSNNLTVAEIGIIYGVISIITILSAYNDFGVTDSLNYFIPKYYRLGKTGRIKALLLYGLLIQLVTSFILCLFFIVFAKTIATSYMHTPEAEGVIKVFSLYFIGINLFQLITTYFVVVQNTFLNKLSDFLRLVFVCISIIYISLFQEKNIINYSVTWIIGLYMGLIIAMLQFYFLYYRKYLQNSKLELCKKDLKEIISYGFFAMLSGQASMLLSQIDMQIILFLLGATAAGLYTNYLTIIGVAFILFGPIFTFLTPVFSDLNSRGNYEQIKKIKTTLDFLFLKIYIPLSLFFFIFGKEIATVLFGEKFSESGVILKFSAFFLVFNFFLQVNFAILGGLGKMKERVKILGIVIIINIISTFFLVSIIGTNGAALGAGIGWILIYILSQKAVDIKCTFSQGQKKEIIFDIFYFGTYAGIITIAKIINPDLNFYLLFFGLIIGGVIFAFRSKRYILSLIKEINIL